MSDDWLAAEPLIRGAAFAVVFATMAGWEVVAPRREPASPRRVRWPTNLGILAVDTILLRWLFPAAAVGGALLVEARGWGLLNSVAAPWWIAIPVAVVMLDLTLYWQHRLFHAVPWLWRLHRMHHADTDFDVTTGVRFHPGEILLSMLIKLAAIAALGAPAVAVVIFEVVLNATSMFNHGNVRLTDPLDRAIRRVIVTPDMHRVHHSALPVETNSNFGFNLSLWDYVFRTYQAQPRLGHAGMMIGLDAFRSRRDARLDRLLLQPLLRGEAARTDTHG